MAIHLTFRQDRCKGCGLCVTACPKHILALEGGAQFLEGDLLAVEEQVVDGEDSAGFRQFLHHDGSFPSFFILSKT